MKKLPDKDKVWKKLKTPYRSPSYYEEFGRIAAEEIRKEIDKIILKEIMTMKLRDESK